MSNKLASARLDYRAACHVHSPSVRKKERKKIACFWPRACTSTAGAGMLSRYQGAPRARICWGPLRLWHALRSCCCTLSWTGSSSPAPRPWDGSGSREAAKQARLPPATAGFRLPFPHAAPLLYPPHAKPLLHCCWFPSTGALLQLPLLSASRPALVALRIQSLQQPSLTIRARLAACTRSIDVKASMSSRERSEREKKKGGNNNSSCFQSTRKQQNN